MRFREECPFDSGRGHQFLHEQERVESLPRHAISNFDGYGAVQFKLVGPEGFEPPTKPL